MSEFEPDELLNAGESVAEINDYLYKNNLTDGLPVIPPEPYLVEQAIAFTGLAKDHVIATVAPWWAEATVEKVAANAVMAGCEPKHLPVVIAALQTVTDPGWNLYGAQATTNPGGPILIVNGPCRDYLEMNYRSGCLGPGTRANATIGRALRLILINIGGARPGESDLATQGSPAKYTMCFAEHEAESPWDSFATEHGWARDANTMTSAFAISSVNVHDNESKHADGLLKTLCGSLTIQGMNNFTMGGKGQVILILGPEWARSLASGGYSKQDIRERVWNEATLRLSSFSTELAEAITKKRSTIDDGLVRIAAAPDRIHIVVAGGPGRHSTAVFCFREATFTREILFPESVKFIAR